MTAHLFIPPRTRAELASPSPRGQRHEQMKKIAMPLIGNGLTAEAVFVQLRSMYQSDVTDREINDVIAWTISKNPQPCGRNYTTHAYSARPLLAPIKPERVTGAEARASTEKWLNGFRCDVTSPRGSPATIYDRQRENAAETQRTIALSLSLYVFFTFWPNC